MLFQPYCSLRPNSSVPRLSKKTFTLSVALAVNALLVPRTRGEDHVDLKFENYQEEAGRIHVQTEGALFEVLVHPSVSVSGQFVYDSISGATPNGGPPPMGSDQVPTTIMSDERLAGSLGAAVRWGGNQTTSPLLAYSWEHDYQSSGIALNHTMDFFEKNTTLALGAAYTHDNISPTAADTISPSYWQNRINHKDSIDALVGVTQLLGPKTVLTANLSLGFADGYMADPYKGVRFDGYPAPNALFREIRPDYRDKQIGYLSLTHFITPLNGSAELGFRLYHDSYGILSETVTASWFQKVGKYVVISPMFRFMNQSAAGFYVVQLPGDPQLPEDDPDYVPIPAYYSADYRLSAMQTFTYGISVMARVHKNLSIDLGYKRYAMMGTDGITSQSAYPTANVFTAGVSVWF